jgi:tetratricopeptide (TPR) repeat protein
MLRLLRGALNNLNSLNILNNLNNLNILNNQDNAFIFNHLYYSKPLCDTGLSTRPLGTDCRVGAIYRRCADTGQSRFVDCRLRGRRQEKPGRSRDQFSPFVARRRPAIAFETRPRWGGPMIETALDQHASGQNLGDAIGLYGRTWQQARQKPQFPAERLTAMRSRLEQNRVWLDSALVKLEKEMGAPIVTNPDKAREYIETADAYAAVVQGTDAEKSAALLMQAAGLAKTMDDAPKSLDLYTRLVSQFPKSKHAPTALFMTGFIYNEMGDLDKARAAYEQFIRNYPDNEMVLSAKMEIKNLGKSTDDILREFEQQQKQGTLR